MTTVVETSPTAPELNQLVQVRDRYWVVTEVRASTQPPDLLSGTPDAPQHLVFLSSVDDDGIGDTAQVIWELEPGAVVLETATLPTPEIGRFDDPARLDAFINAVRWGAVTSADTRTLQAPFRSGITIEDYQLDPVVRALSMPRVNLFIADDTGLGKTIEAGLVVQELLLRHRARTVMVICPASLQTKWQMEMDEKFGLDFEIINSELLRQLRRSYGVGANPFDIFPRSIVSIDWLKTPKVMRVLAQKLPSSPRYPRAFDLMIVDEVHQCAPSGRGKYAVDSLRTQAIRKLSPHFEHRLFLSATPHNGFTESFTALLELLDPQRFQRGVQPSEDVLRGAMIRRLKQTLRAELPPNPDGSPRFPVRKVIEIEVDYPDDEKRVHSLLRQYTESRRKQAPGRSGRAASDFVTLLLKKRLFSSPAAFASTLETHIHTVERNAVAKSADDSEVASDLREAIDRATIDRDDDLDVAISAEEALATAAEYSHGLTDEQKGLLDEMLSWGEANRFRPDAKTEKLLEWIDDQCRPPDPETGKREWNDTRVIVFTEYRDTQLYLKELLAARGITDDRLSLIYGGVDSETRDRITAEFQHHPSLRPLRILLATDAASEGIDLQRHCNRLVHVEIPFSPTRLEQRNGRIDRHGQPAPEVLVHHFVGAGYQTAPPGSLEADLDFLARIARKVSTIRTDLGESTELLSVQVEEAMLGYRSVIDEAAIKGKDPRSTLTGVERSLREQVARLRAELDSSIAELRLTPDAVEQVVSVGLELGRQPKLQPTTLNRPDTDKRPSGPVFEVPQLTRSWAAASAGLYDEVTEKQLPITFDGEVARNADDVVLAHLGHRLVAQSMRLLRAEVWSNSDTARLSRVTARLAGDDLDTLMVVAHARLVITGGDGHRLHEEVITAGGQISEGRFKQHGVQAVDGALESGTDEAPSDAVERELIALWPRIQGGVYTALESRGRKVEASIARKLDDRVSDDIEAIAKTLNDLKRNIQARIDELGTDPNQQQLVLDLDPDERDQYRRDVAALQRRIDAIPGEIETEKAAIRQRYREPRTLLFPAAVTFLVPERMRHTTAVGGKL